jgi:hypothetical protein
MNISPQAYAYYKNRSLASNAGPIRETWSFEL